MANTFRRFVAYCATPICVLGCGHLETTPEDINQIEFLINNFQVQKGEAWLLTCRRLIEEYGEKAVPYLITHLDSTSADVRRGSAFCLGHIGGGDSAIDILRIHLGDPDLLVRLECAASLCMLREYDGVPLLFHALRHEKSRLVRKVALQTLRAAFEVEFGFNPDAPVAERELAVQRYEVWWEDNKRKYVN